MKKPQQCVWSVNMIH